MGSKQQTALEWFAQRIQSDKIFSFDVVLKQAIQMEREHIVSAYSHGWHDGQDEIINRIAHIDKGGDEAGLKHFNNTYKNKAQ